MTEVVETEKEPPCNTCGHMHDLHEDGGDCQEEGCECTLFSVFIEEGDEPIPETRGPR